jgi:hypothetical protein
MDAQQLLDDRSFRQYTCLQAVIFGLLSWTDERQ